MKVNFILMLFILMGISVAAQDNSSQMDIARTFMRQGDYSNAVLVLKKVYDEKPDVSTAKNLALCYHYQKDNENALKVMNSVVGKAGADDQCFQILGSIYSEMEKFKDAEKVLKKGLKEFPESGTLYNDLGELQWRKQSPDAIKFWEKGIEKDPAFPRNYYNAARFYYFTTDKVWSQVYGEIFVNMEPNGSRSAEIKEMLVEGYKKLFTQTDLAEGKVRNEFTRAYLASMKQQSAVASSGISTESLSMIRTRFVLHWAEAYPAMPFKLFDFHRQLLQEGIFDTYNQWLFESSRNLPAYQNWINAHPVEFALFDKMQKSYVFKMPPGQFYNK